MAVMATSTTLSLDIMSTLPYARELLLVEGISKAGLGNWQMIIDYVGAQTMEEMEEHGLYH